MRRKRQKYAYTYTDNASLEVTARDSNNNPTSANIGTKSDNKRVYSVAAAEQFMADGTIMKPQSATDMAVIAVSPDKTVTITGADDGVLIRVKRENGALKSMSVYDNLTFTNSAATLTIQDLEGVR